MESTVTIVDDSNEFRFFFCCLLERKLQVNCLSLASFADVKDRASEVLKSRVVVLDINLGPGQPDGVAVFEWLRAHAYEGKIFFLTGHAKGSPEVKRAASTGVSIFEKPMRAQEIVLVLKNAMLECEGANCVGPQ